MYTDYKFSYANINKTAFTQELGKRGAYYANVVMWTTLFSLPVFLLIDYLFCKDSWIDLSLIRLVGWGISYLIYTYSAKQNWAYLQTVTWFVGVNIAIYSIIVAIVPISGPTLAYFLILSIAMLIVNTTIFWPPIYSIYTCLVSYAIILLIYSLKNRVDKYSIMIEHGGGVYFIISAFSCLLAYTRFNILCRDTERSVMIDDANNKLVDRNEKIKDQQFEIAETNRKLQVVNTSSQENMTVLMHDYKTFSDTVKTSLDSLKESSYNLLPSQIDVINSIGTQNDKLIYLAQKLGGTVSNVAKEDTTIHFKKEYFDINPEVEKAVLEIAESAMLKSMSLQLNISPAANNVYQDKLFIEQVLNKLMNNVIRHSQTGSVITVRAEHKNDKAVIEAISHGAAIGMDKLTEMVDKLKVTSINDEAALTELGLAATKRLVETMNGTFSYNSEDATGNYFKIVFPSS
jgi:signal transduction histidine kinase